MDTWDYIVVGAGSAGCAVAARLSEDPSTRVLLLEAGPPPRGFWARVPAGMAKMIGSDLFDWRFMTEPVPSLRGRRIPWPRGKALGGSSAINGMVYTRGNRRDYNHWSALGNAGWSWQDVLPFYLRMEDNEGGPSPLHGSGGPVKVSDARPVNEAITAFIEAASRCGAPRREDFSVAGEEGSGVLQATIHKGVRQSSHVAYTAPLRHRRNLTILPEVHVQRILFSDGAARGVTALQDGHLRTLNAGREVIVSAGTLGSPHLLMLSGIGDGAHLQQHGITTQVHLPGVGQNLQDHYGNQLKVQTHPGWSYNANLRGWRKYLEGLRYLFTRDGFLAASATMAAATFRSSLSEDYADIQIGFRPISYTQAPNGDLIMDRVPAISANVYRVRPASRGEVLLRSADPMEAPAFHPNYMSAVADQRATIEGLRHLRRIFATEPIASAIVGEFSPGPGIRTDEQLLDFIIQQGKSSYHPVGTCKMGNDPLAVVDARLRVHGVRGLRVVDASVMPTPTSGNTNAAAMMIGEKGAELIREDAVA